MADNQRRRSTGGVGRVPPHNLAAEESLLGALLLSQDALAAAAEQGVVAGDFYKPAHQHIYEAVRVLVTDGQPVDAVTVAEELRRNGLLDEIGGPGVLLDLQASTPAISNAARYARIVQDAALLRRLIGVAGEIAEIGYTGPDDVQKAVDDAEARVFEIAQHRVTDSTKPLSDLLNEALTDLEQAYDRGAALTGTPTGFTDLDELLSGLQPSTLNVIGARPSMGKCVAWDTELVDPATGALVTAADLHRRGVSGEWVQVVALDHDARLRVVSPSAFVDDGVKPVVEVRTRLGRCIRTTLAHPFLTEHGWRRVGELAPGVRVGTPARLPYFGTGPLPGGEVVLLARFLGDAGLRTSEAARRDEAVSRCRQVGVDAVAVLRRHGLWRVGDDELRMPRAVYELPRAKLLHFLERLLETNRSLRPGAAETASFAAPSEPLVRAVQHLLLRFGVVTALHRDDGQRGRHRVVHRLETEPVSHRTADADAGALVGYPAPRPVGVGGRGPRPAPPPLLGSVVWDEIVAITPAGHDQVFDLTVPDLHNFVAADVFVHNTALALGIATHVAVEERLPVLFFSLEMGHKELTQRVLAAEARVDSQKMRTGRLNEQDWKRIGQAIGRLDSPLFIDDNPNVTVMEIRAKARRMAAKSGRLGLVVVDYLQLMSGRSDAESRQVEVSEISRGLKILARELETPIIALSQLSRNLESRADKRPMLADLRESGSIEQDADVVMFIYRDEVYNADSQDRGVAEVIVAKHRNGPIGSKRLVFLGSYTRFDNAARGV